VRQLANKPLFVQLLALVVFFAACRTSTVEQSVDKQGNLAPYCGIAALPCRKDRTLGSMVMTACHAQRRGFKCVLQRARLSASVPATSIFQLTVHALLWRGLFAIGAPIWRADKIRFHAHDRFLSVRAVFGQRCAHLLSRQRVTFISANCSLGYGPVGCRGRGCVLPEIAMLQLRGR